MRAAEQRLERDEEGALIRSEPGIIGGNRHPVGAGEQEGGRAAVTLPLKQGAQRLLRRGVADERFPGKSLVRARRLALAIYGDERPGNLGGEELSSLVELVLRGEQSRSPLLRHGGHLLVRHDPVRVSLVAVDRCEMEPAGPPVDIEGVLKSERDLLR